MAIWRCNLTGSAPEARDGGRCKVLGSTSRYVGSLISEHYTSLQPPTESVCGSRTLYSTASVRRAQQEPWSRRRGSAEHTARQIGREAIRQTCLSERALRNGAVKCHPPVYLTAVIRQTLRYQGFSGPMHWSHGATTRCTPRARTHTMIRLVGRPRAAERVFCPWSVETHCSIFFTEVSCVCLVLRRSLWNHAVEDHAEASFPLLHHQALSPSAALRHPSGEHAPQISITDGSALSPLGPPGYPAAASKARVA